MIRDSTSNTYISNKWTNSSTGTYTSHGCQPPSHQWETGRIVHIHKTHSSMQSIPDQWATPYPPHTPTPDPLWAMLTWCPQGLAYQLPWAGACHQWLNPFLNVWHMCVTSSPIGLHQRHPRRLPPSGPGDKMKQCTLGVMYEHLRPTTLRVTLTSPKMNCYHLSPH